MIPSIFDYLPEHAEQLMKLAERETESPTLRKMKIIGKGMLGFGAGSAIGFGAGALADKLYERSKGHPIPRSRLLQVAPLLTGAMGLSLGLHEALKQEELNRVRED